ncbi:SDR family NAD(P)-dependent oxidoreductase [Gammaproteobacteria bacterium AB-CW1]|uniref:SDR family NAD(P)-dependent oxidoreductase n=1 Tax=Natronospira elongata TaxID=3110268 RepID=A0AAP6MJP0_9GAMM|nr:SDR family NAD(P)-dependent oxidoreductase [Gammaproteobacteria bacterium AB-CW1]
MKNALVIGASGGIGSALTKALAAEGHAVTGLSRSEHGLDITDEDSIQAHFRNLSGPFHRILITTGALQVDDHRPEKTLRQLNREALTALFLVNAVGPALAIKHALPLLAKDEPAVLAALSARVGSIGDNRAGGWYSYRAAKAALNMIIHGAAIELGRSRKQAICVALHPGTVASRLTKPYLGRHPSVTPETAAKNLLAVITGLSRNDSGGFFDWAGETIPW